MHRRLCLFPRRTHWGYSLRGAGRRGGGSASSRCPRRPPAPGRRAIHPAALVPPAQALSRLSVGINMWSNSVEGDLSGLAGVLPLPDAPCARAVPPEVWLLRATIDALLDEVLTTPEDPVGEKESAASGERNSTWVFQLIGAIPARLLTLRPRRGSRRVFALRTLGARA